MPEPSTSQLLSQYGLPVWPKTYPVRDNVRAIDAGLVNWGAPQTGFLGDFGISAGVTSAIAAITAAVAGAAGATGTVIKIIKDNENQAIKDARASGASPAEIQKIRRKFRRQKQKARQKARAARKRRRQQKRRGRRRGPPRPGRRPGRRKGRKVLTSAQKASRRRKAAEDTEKIAAGFSFATDILRRASAFGQQVETGASVDPFTGQAVVHRPVTEVRPAAAVPAPIGTAPVIPPGPRPGAGILETLKRPVVAGVPLWGVLVVAGGGLILLKGKRRR